MSGLVWYGGTLIQDLQYQLQQSYASNEYLTQRCNILTINAAVLKKQVVDLQQTKDELECQLKEYQKLISVRSKWNPAYTIPTEPKSAATVQLEGMTKEQMVTALQEIVPSLRTNYLCTHCHLYSTSNSSELQLHHSFCIKKPTSAHIRWKTFVDKEGACHNQSMSVPLVDHWITK